jgi:L-ascorbate metabolism protein UlaG (beta-lactamase superfamily)
MSKASIRYLSWSAFLLTSPAGVRILVDPFLSGSQHGPIAPSPLSASELGGVDLVLVTHAAKDHVGDAFEVLRAGSATFGASLDVRLLGAEAGVAAERMVSMVPNSPWRIGDCTVIPVAAVHISSARFADGHYLIGQPLCYFVRLGERNCVFHGGDTAISLDFQLYGQLYMPTVAIVGIGGLHQPGRQPVVELSPSEAAMLGGMLGAATIVPCHYLPDSGAADEFTAALPNVAPQAQAAVLGLGSTLELAE